jgi:transcriptional regulator with XRE-family HTH domain
MTIGERLRRERLRAGLSQVDLATRIGVSPEFACRVEHGQRSPSREVVERWAEATGAGAADLILDGPMLFDVAFVVEAPVLDPFAARRVLEQLDPRTRRLVSVWPAVDGALRLRARASVLPILVGLTGTEIPSVGMLHAPTVSPVREAAELTAWLRAVNEQGAAEQVELRLERARASGRVSIARAGRLFVAVVADLAADASLRLQELVDGSPLGLFVPIGA